MAGPDPFQNRLEQAAVLTRQGRSREAAEVYSEVLRQAPGHFGALHELGLLALADGRNDQAVRLFGMAVQVQPGSAAAQGNLGSALQALGQTNAAVAAFDRAVALEGRSAALHFNRANALRRARRFDEALAGYEQALMLAPTLVQAWCNRGVVLMELNRFDDAIASQARALALDPTYAEAHYDKALVQLLRGDFANGWRNFEYRKQTAQPTGNRGFRQPPLTTLNGVAGKTVLLHAEQGLGDTIQFSRYASLLRDLGARVLLAPQPPLRHLLRPLADAIVDADDSGLDFDCHASLLSLPLLFGTTLESVPARTPYLVPEAALVTAWKARLGGHGLKIGIAWQGNPDNAADAGRSFALRALAPLTRHPGVRLISLQKGAGREQVAGAGFAVETLGPDFDAGPDAFRDTAAVMASLDLVICADTAITHLAGALGAQVWLALMAVPDWRWMMGRADTPWYPRMRLFRQVKDGDWAPVFAAMTAALNSVHPPDRQV